MRDRVSEHHGVPSCGRKEPDQHVDRRRLPSPVGAQQGEELVLGHSEPRGLDRMEGLPASRERLLQTPHLDRCPLLHLSVGPRLHTGLLRQHVLICALLDDEIRVVDDVSFRETPVGGRQEVPWRLLHAHGVR
eukprot:746434-Hanusia_phi.AAC.1